MLSARVIFLGVLFSLLPDADVIAFRVGVPYAHPLGHRGFSHSLVFALLIALVAAALPAFRDRRGRVFLFLWVSAVSHGVLDALTSGGLGVGFFIPWDNQRYFLPIRPIRVSPLTAGAFFSERGVKILLSEFYTVWLPCAGIAATGWLFRRQLKARA
ncbi:MAG: metal-dependent hydrolase [Turneriella sp.]